MDNGSVVASNRPLASANLGPQGPPNLRLNRAVTDLPMPSMMEELEQTTTPAAAMEIKGSITKNGQTILKRSQISVWID